ncbi:MAG: membrane protein insertase YidC [Cocleimonas sp.]|nr:membrane protein insertase YidC [Cocleimonas sp.]
MDQQRPLLYFALLFLSYLIWMAWMEDHAPKPVITEASSAATTQNIPNNNGNSGNRLDIPEGVATAPAATSAVPTEVVQANKASEIHVKTDVLDIIISTEGGSIIQADLLTYPISLEEKDNPVRVLDRAKAYAAQSGLISTAQGLAPNHYAQFSSPQSSYELLDGSTELVVPLTWTNGKGITVTKRFTFKEGSFLVAIDQEVDNQSGTVWKGNNYQQLTHGTKSSSGGMMMGIQAYVGAAYYNEKYEKVSFSDMEDEKVSSVIQGGWAAMLEHYFVSAWIPPKEEKNTYYTNYIQKNNRYIMGVKSPQQQIATGTKGVFSNQFYVGPKNQAELEKISHGLDLTVDYGVFSFVSKPLFWIMQSIHNVVGNWGWTIILVTLLIKIVFFYPSAISYRSMAKMKKMAPKIKELNERFKGDPQAKQKATMDFYRKEKINPLGGCLPMLIQMPVFMGLYWVLLESVELRQAPWLGWYQDLSVLDPFYILPLIFGASMYFQQKLNPPQMDPMQQKIFAFLPIVFTVMFLFFPAGLVLYWVVNNLLSIAQQWFITRQIEAGKSTSVIALGKKLLIKKDS